MHGATMQSNSSSPDATLGSPCSKYALLVAGILQRLRRGGFDVRQLVLREGAEGVRAAGLHRRLDVFQPLPEARVAARLQQVGASRHGQRAAREDRRDVQRVRARGVGYAQVPVELMRQLVVQVHRDRIERPARHVHLVARHPRLVVVHRQRVAQLHAKREVLAGGEFLHPADQPQRRLVLQVFLEDRVRDVHLGETEIVVQDAQHAVFAQQRRVHLDDSVQPALLQQIPGDALDLVGRAAVHRGEGDAVGELGRDR